MSLSPFNVKLIDTNGEGLFFQLRDPRFELIPLSKADQLNRAIG